MRECSPSTAGRDRARACRESRRASTALLSGVGFNGSLIISPFFSTASIAKADANLMFLRCSPHSVSCSIIFYDRGAPSSYRLSFDQDARKRQMITSNTRPDPLRALHRVRVRRLDDSSGYRRKSLRLTAQRDDCLLLLSQAFEDRHCKIFCASGGGDAGKQRTQVRLNALKTYDNRRRPYLSIRRPVGRCLRLMRLVVTSERLSPLSRRLR